MFPCEKNMTEPWRERAHLWAMTIISCTHARREKQTCSMVVDSHFLWSKSPKCMEIVSNPTIMDVSHTMDSYGPSSVLLAVIALLLRGALSAAEIGKAHRIQALAAIHNCVCIQKKSDDYQRLISMIYDWPFQVEMGNTIKRQIHCIQKKDGKHQRWDQETIRPG